jgi:hypothetical protein
MMTVLQLEHRKHREYIYVGHADLQSIPITLTNMSYSGSFSSRQVVDLHYRT